MSSLQKELFRKHFPPLPPGSIQLSGSQGLAKRRKRDYSPSSWKDYFDRSEDVITSPGNVIDAYSFRVYFKGSAGPVLLLLHGGGHSALSWAVFAVAVTKFLECEVVAVDLRAHGETSTSKDADLSASTLVEDVVAIADAVLKDRDVCPPVIMIGHSMGGAIATRAAASGSMSSVVGLAVIDVVEGTAMESLNSMQTFLKTRPSSFSSVSNCIEWSIRSGQLKNVESARVSMPGQVKRSSRSSSHLPSTSAPIAEEDEENIQDGDSQGSSEDMTSSDHKTCLAPEDSSGECVWRVDLKETESYWHGWFEGLSKLFLSLPIPKLLILAGIDRLDKDLTIGQMQGKFQMQVMSGCGHSVHEDVPDKVAEVISGYLVRHKFARRKDDVATGQS